MAHSMKDDFLVKREKKADDATASDDATFAWFSPVGAPETRDRHRLLIVREEGDLVSVQPAADARFKVGLDAWRWKEPEGGSPITYVVTKTTPSRVDLKKA